LADYWWNVQTMVRSLQTRYQNKLLQLENVLRVYHARIEFRLHDLLIVNKAVPSMVRSTEYRMGELHVLQPREQAYRMRYHCLFQSKVERMKKIQSQMKHQLDAKP